MQQFVESLSDVNMERTLDFDDIRLQRFLDSFAAYFNYSFVLSTFRRRGGSAHLALQDPGSTIRRHHVVVWSRPRCGTDHNHASCDRRKCA